MRQAVYDIFLAHAAQDASVAASVEKVLREGGLSVFRMSSISAGASVFDVMRKEIAASRAVLALVTPASVGAVSVGLEIGVAMSWKKPIYLLTSGVTAQALPFDLSRFHIIEAKRLADAIPALRGMIPVNDEAESHPLKSLYTRFAVPADRLLEEPELLERFTEEFNRLTKRQISAEALMTIMLRLRKRGDLPRLGRTARFATVSP